MEEASALGQTSKAHRRAAGHGGWFVALAVAIVVLDRVTKWVVARSIDPGEAWPSRDWPVHLVHFTNSGAAFGIFQNGGPLLAFTGLVAVVAVFVYLMNPGFAQPLIRAGLALMLGGAIGNLIDRFASGEVVDFIKFPYWPAFNAADSSITIGVLLLLWAMTRPTAGEPTPAS